MNFSSITDRLFLVTWTDLSPYETNVLVYHGSGINLIIDTFLGPSKMKQMLRLLPEPSSNTPYIIVNTHYHFDHVWGNSAFLSSVRISTSLCYQMMKRHFEVDKAANLTYWEPDNQICLPNCLITSTLTFPEAGIEVFPSPGHSEDSCSVFFRQEGVLAVGDNLERPIPYLESQDWQKYLETLDHYASIQADKLIAGHGIVTQTDIETSKQYIYAWQTHQTEKYDAEPYKNIHRQNKLHLSAHGDGVVGHTCPTTPSPWAE